MDGHSKHSWYGCRLVSSKTHDPHQVAQTQFGNPNFTLHRFFWCKNFSQIFSWRTSKVLCLLQVDNGKLMLTMDHLNVLFFCSPNERMMTFFARKRPALDHLQILLNESQLSLPRHVRRRTKKSQPLQPLNRICCGKKVDNVSCVFGDLYYSDFGGLSLAT